MTPTEQPVLPLTSVESQFAGAARAFAAHTAAINVSKGFCVKPPETTDQILSQFMLVVSELAEATEGIRKDLMDDKLPNRKMVEVELADSLIRILNIGEWAGYDVVGVAIEKSRYNETRPYRHGDKKV